MGKTSIRLMIRSIKCSQSIELSIWPRHEVLSTIYWEESSLNFALRGHWKLLWQVEILKSCVLDWTTHELIWVFHHTLQQLLENIVVSHWICKIWVRQWNLKRLVNTCLNAAGWQLVIKTINIDLFDFIQHLFVAFNEWPILIEITVNLFLLLDFVNKTLKCIFQFVGLTLKFRHHAKLFHLLLFWDIKFLLQHLVLHLKLFL